MFNIRLPKFKTEPLSDDKKKKLTLSESECDNMEMRPVKCPYCNFTITTVFADIKGHFFAKCPKCKMEAPINLAYFRRSRTSKRQEKINFDFKDIL